MTTSPARLRGLDRADQIRLTDPYVPPSARTAATHRGLPFFFRRTFPEPFNIELYTEASCGGSRPPAQFSDRSLPAIPNSIGKIRGVGGRPTCLSHTCLHTSVPRRSFRTGYQMNRRAPIHDGGPPFAPKISCRPAGVPRPAVRPRLVQEAEPRPVLPQTETEPAAVGSPGHVSG